MTQHELRGGAEAAKTSRALLFVIAPLLILVLPVAVYLTDRSVSEGTLPRNVSVAGINVAGLSPGEAFTVVRSYEEDLHAEPSSFIVNGMTRTSSIRMTSV